MRLLPFTLLLVLGNAAFAADKICFGTGEAKGERFSLVDLGARRVTIDAGRRTGYVVSGTYPRKGRKVVRGRDGVSYRVYDLGVNDGSNELLVDPVLLKAGTKGRVKVRNQGEGFGSVTYLCRDERS